MKPIEILRGAGGLRAEAGGSRDRRRGLVPAAGASQATFYAWKKKYAHLGVSELRRLRQLEEENARLKRLVADPQPREAHAIVCAPLGK